MGETLISRHWPFVVAVAQMLEEVGGEGHGRKKGRAKRQVAGDGSKQTNKQKVSEKFIGVFIP